MIKTFSEFIIESKNDPIQELQEDKLCIILMGTPGIGKSTFSRTYIQVRKQIKTFSTDDVSLMFTKDPNQYHPGSSTLTINKLLSFLQTGQSFIYDTTGTHREQIFKITDTASKSGYKIVFIHLVGTLEMSLQQNTQRDRQVDVDYIKKSYSSQFPNMKLFYSQIHPYSYYVIYNKDGKYVFYKYNGERLLKKKLDKYI